MHIPAPSSRHGWLLVASSWGPPLSKSTGGHYRVARMGAHCHLEGLGASRMHGVLHGSGSLDRLPGGCCQANLAHGQQLPRVHDTWARGVMPGNRHLKPTGALSENLLPLLPLRHDLGQVMPSCCINTHIGVKGVTQTIWVSALS